MPLKFLNDPVKRSETHALCGLVVQRLTEAGLTPKDEDFQRWAAAALAPGPSRFDITIRLVDEDESRQLNASYRKRDTATNVLSFPAALGAQIQSRIEAQSGARPLGDLVICAPLVNREALVQGKPALDHWAHLTVHGILHLLGHDHEQPEQANAMEHLETEILASLGIGAPYAAR